MKQYQNLELLLAGYFHQDWHVDEENWISVLEGFAAHESPERVQGAVLELKQLLASENDDRRLQNTVASLGCEFLPDQDSSMREWLVEVSKRLEGSRGGAAGG